MSIHRDIGPWLQEQSQLYPVVTLVGPRQSGKTTLCQNRFPEKSYVSLEDLDQRKFATEDPRGFLNGFPSGAIIDEFQRVPELVSYIQTDVDANANKEEMGRYILTGSENLRVSETVSQSLAGRTAMATLLPLSFPELQRFENAPQSLWETVLTGGYPAIFDRNAPAFDWYGNYTRTYIERDVRALTNISDLNAFQEFLELAAGHTGQLLNLSNIGNAIGVDHKTIRSWLSVLEASYLVFRLRPYSRNIKKRVVKTPKLYFYDTGVVCYLLGIRTAEQLRTHPLRGAIFESWVVAEFQKIFTNRGEEPRFYFYRDHAGLEVDLLIDNQSPPLSIEIKSAQTIDSAFFQNMEKLAAAMDTEPQMAVVYGGGNSQTRTKGRVMPWNELQA